MDQQATTPYRTCDTETERTFFRKRNTAGGGKRKMKERERGKRQLRMREKESKTLLTFSNQRWKEREQK